MADRRPPRQRGHHDEKVTGAPRKEPRQAPTSANKAIPPSRIGRAADVAADPIPDAQADLRDRRRDALANPAETAAHAREAAAAHHEDDADADDQDALDETADDNLADEDDDEDERDGQGQDARAAVGAGDEAQAHRDRVRRNYDVPISLGDASLHRAPFKPVGVGEDPAREPRLFEPEEPDVDRTPDPTRAAPFLADDEPDVADNPRENIAAREQADSPELGADSPGHQQDQ